MDNGLDGREDQKNNIYVKNFCKPIDASVDLSKDIREVEQRMIEDLKKIFSPYGELGSIFVKFDYEKRQPFAFVSFIHSQSARDVIANFTKRYTRAI